MCQSYWMGCYSNALHPLHSPKNILGLLSVILCVKLSKWGFENTSGVKVNDGRGERLAANSNLSKSLCIGKAIPFISRDWTLSRFRKVVWSEWLRAGEHVDVWKSTQRSWWLVDIAWLWSLYTGANGFCKAVAPTGLPLLVWELGLLK